MTKKILLLFVCAASLFSAKAQTNVPALILTSQTWTLAGSPYIINQNTWMDTGVVVIVQPGVEIKANSNLKFSINGEFQARGKWDSVIKISKLELEFNAKSKDFNPINGRGAYLNYCHITGTGIGNKVISTFSTAIRIDHCEFVNSYYTLFVNSAMNDSTLSWVTNTKFYGDQYGGGSAIFMSNATSKLTVINCLFERTSDIFAYGSVIFRNNTCRKMYNIYFHLYKNSEISCNRFINMREVYVSLRETTGKASLDLYKNTFDSIGYLSSYGMLKIGRNGSSMGKFGRVAINDNNFLKSIGTAAKISIASSNQTPTSTDTIDFRNNYWGTTDSATIENYIWDYSDNINLYGRVNYSGYKSIPVVGCSYNSTCAIADFYYTITDSTISVTDNSYSTKPYKTRWYFGDGAKNENNAKNASHNYEKAGIYKVCLVVTDSLGVPCDSMCRVIEVFSKSKCEAKYYFATDTTNKKVVYIVNTSKGTNTKTKYFWTFGDGSGSSAKNPTHSYSTTGTYQLCLTIFDTLAGCYSTFCDYVDINTESMQVQVLDEKDVLNIGGPEVLSNLNAFPNPGSGKFMLTMHNNRAGEIKTRVTNTTGQVVFETRHSFVAGNNAIDMDLSHLQNGLYFINVSAKGYSTMIKFVINK